MIFTCAGRQISMNPLYLKMRPVITNLDDVYATRCRGDERINITIASRTDISITAQMSTFL